MTVPKAYHLLGSLVALEELGEKLYNNLIKLMPEYHDPPPSEIVQHFKFNTCTCGVNDDRIQRRLLTVALIVCRVNHCRIQRRLLSVTDMKLDLK